MPLTTGVTRPVGAHAPVAGGLAKALPYVDAASAEVLQVFVSNPRGWALRRRPRHPWLWLVHTNDSKDPTERHVGHAADIATLRRLRP